MSVLNPKRSISPYSATGGNSPLVLQGPRFLQRPEGMRFIPNRDFVYCRICGTIYQPELNRVSDEEYTAEVILAAELLRREWSQKHAKTHPPSAHRRLAMSGLHCTPEALEKLVPFGIIPVTDIIVNKESEQAGLEAKRMPVNDVEGT